MDQIFYDAVEGNPIIAAVKDMEGLRLCSSLEDIRVVFVLFGDICSISELVKMLKEAGKIVMVHIDLIAGLDSKEIVVDFIRKFTEADGIITTKPSLIRRAKELSMFTVLRYFLLDSMALENIRHQQRKLQPDFIEVLPGAAPRLIAGICRETKTPIIAGGLITDRQTVQDALSAGAIAVSTTNRKVWEM